MRFKRPIANNKNLFNIFISMKFMTGHNNLIMKIVKDHAKKKYMINKHLHIPYHTRVNVLKPNDIKGHFK